MTDRTIFMLVRATQAWLAMPPPDRFAFLEAAIRPILKAHPAVSLRFFDSEFYSARVSDVLMWETADLGAYELVVERLRETLFWDHYFEVLDILPAVENAYATNYQQPALTA